MNGTEPPIVVGIGNVLLRDEGVGVQVVRELDRLSRRGLLDVLPGTRFVDGGTLGLDLLPLIGGATVLVLIDAVDLRLPPGSVTVIRGDRIEGTLGGHVSPHQVGVADLVATARLLGVWPDQASLVGIQPAEIEMGLRLSPPVAGAVSEAVARVCAELRHHVGATLVIA